MYSRQALIKLINNSGSYRGPSVDAGLKALAEIKKDTESFIITDVHEPSHVQTAEIADILQILYPLSKQIDLILLVKQAK